MTRTAALISRLAVWELRGSGPRLAYFVACLAVGVSAVVAVASLSNSIDRRIRSEAKQLLAADLAVSGRRPLPADLEEILAEAPGVERTDIVELVTLTARARESGSTDAPRSQLVELKAVKGHYPFYGRLELDPPLAFSSFEADSVAVGPELLARLGLSLGDEIVIGNARFRIVATIVAEPDRVLAAWSLGPRVLMRGDRLESTGLLTFGSRVLYRALIKLPDSASSTAAEETAEQIRASLSDREYYRVETFSEAQPALRRGLKRLSGYLGLVALLSLMIGGVGVAQSVRAWLTSRLDAIAILKCLGLRPKEALLLFLVQAMLLGGGGSLVGCGLGVVVQFGLVPILGELLPQGLLHPWQPLAILRGLLLGLAVTLLSGLPPLLTVLRVAPARALRRGAQPLPGSVLLPTLAFLTLLLGIAGMAGFQAHSVELGLQFAAGTVATAALLAGAAVAISRAARTIPRDRTRVWLRHGLAALARPGAGTVGAIVALGLGLLVILAMVQTERHLREQLDRELPTGAPSAFFVDVQPDQWPPLRQILSDAGAESIDSVPVITARLAAIDGTTVAELAEATDDRGRRWALTREQRLTYLADLPADNTVLAGRWWSDEVANEASVEQEFAEELGLDVGSRLRFDIQGVPVELTVTSLRRVDWESMAINFYLIVEPGVLEQAPQSRLAAARVEAGREQVVQDQVAVDFPNVTMLRIKQLLDRVVALMTRLGLAVRFLASFTVVAALAILAATISTTSLRRGHEVALLKTLGLTRAGILGAYATEYALVGLAAGIVGTLGGSLVAWIVVTQEMEITWVSRPGLWLLGLVIAAATAIIFGLLSSASALRRRPIEVLRQE